MREPVEQRGRHLCIAKHTGPLSEAQVSVYFFFGIFAYFFYFIFAPLPPLFKWPGLLGGVALTLYWLIITARGVSHTIEATTFVNHAFVDEGSHFVALPRRDKRRMVGNDLRQFMTPDAIPPLAESPRNTARQTIHPVGRRAQREHHPLDDRRRLCGTGEHGVGNRVGNVLQVRGRHREEGRAGQSTRLVLREPCCAKRK
ncbi:hypothetical protein [Paraburkholderia bryophila]|uniref:hypothetical protein n=1 Tax=Paraburkholderia bryophila TaxID=420952 RepID=UPI003AEF6408